MVVKNFKKQSHRNWIAQGDYKIQTIKCADLIDNCFSIVEHDPNFAKVYMKEKNLLLDVLTKADKNLWNMAQQLVNDYYFKTKLNND